MNERLAQARPGTLGGLTVAEAAHIFQSAVDSTCAGAAASQQYQQDDCCSLQGEGGEDDKKKRRKRDRLRSAITKPLGPADPEHKGTALHLRMTYKECTEEQVRLWQSTVSPCSVLLNSRQTQTTREQHCTSVSSVSWTRSAQNRRSLCSA